MPLLTVVPLVRSGHLDVPLPLRESAIALQASWAGPGPASAKRAWNGCTVVGLFLKSFGLTLLVGDVAQAFLEGGDLAEPLHATGFVEPLVGVGLDLQEAGNLG